MLALTGIIGFLLVERLAIIFTDLLNQPVETIEEKDQTCSTSAEYIVTELEKLNNLEMGDLTSMDGAKFKNGGGAGSSYSREEGVLPSFFGAS